MEVINSFFGNIKDKLTNPYFGTLILVLLLHHWELIFGVFNFDEEHTLKEKLLFVENYINGNINWESFIWDAVQALLYMFLGYLIIIFTRSLVLWIEYWLMPSITGKIVNKNVVRKTDYDVVIREREQYFDQYEEQRKNVRIFSRTIDEQTEQIKQKDEELLKQTTTISQTIRELDITKRELQALREKDNEKDNEIKNLTNSLKGVQNQNDTYLDKIKGYEHLFFDIVNQEFYSSINKFPPEIINKAKELKYDNKWDTFLHLGNFLEKGGSMSQTTINEMVKRGLAFEINNREGLTPIGQILYHYNEIFADHLDERLLLSGD